MEYLKQSTAATVLVGPVLDSTGAAYTSAVIGDFNITKNGTTAAMAAAATATHSHEGHYLILFTTGNTDTLGRLDISCNKSTYAMPPARFSVLASAAFDTLITNGTLASTTSGRTIVVDAAGLADANVVKLGPTGSGTAQTARDIGASVLLSSGTGTGQLDFTSGVVKANTTQFAGSAITAASGIPEVKLTNGAHGGAAGVLTLSRIIVASATTNEPAVKLTGNGVGGAIVATGGSTGPGAEFIGGASGGNGMSIYSQASDRGLYIQGSGSAGGVYIEGGGTGPGMYITGNTYGLEVHGGATNGTGIYATGGTATGYGIQAEAGSHAMYLHTTDGGDGIHFTGSLGGVGFVGDITGTLSTVTTLTNLPAITANWLTATGIASNAITSAKIASGAITTSTFASGAINAAAIAADAIGASELAADAVAEIADAVWDELLSGHAISGSAGAGLSSASSAGDPWSTALPGAYSAGSAGYILGTNLDATISSRGTSTLTQTQVTGGAYALNSSSFAFASAHDFTTTQKTSIGTAVAASAVASVTGNVGGSVGSVLGGINTTAGVITTLDALDTAQDTQHGTTQTAIGDVPTNAELAVAIITGLTTALTESFRAAGNVGSVSQLLQEIAAHLGRSAITGTTKTIYKVNNTTAAKTYTLDNGTTPTAIEETT